MVQLEKIKGKWAKENVKNFQPVDVDYIQMFESKNNVVLPNDLKEYFRVLNGTGLECTDELYEFYPIERIKRVSEEFQDWEGIPNYRPLVNVMDTQDLFVFANFSFNLFVYAIKLCQEKALANEVYVLCGEEYKKIANSFSNFLDLYFDDATELQLNNEES